MFNIRLKNFRCFSARHPAAFEIGPGFTAFVGPNNSGKSAALRSFYELRHLIGVFAQAENLQIITSPRPYQAAYQDVPDPDELRFNGSAEPISLEVVVEVLDADRKTPFVLRLDQETDNPVNWVVTGELGGSKVVRSGSDDLQTEDGRSVSASVIAELLKPAEDTLYVGPFRGAVAKTSGSYFDLKVGTEFIAQWDDWKTGTSRRGNVQIQRVMSDIAAIFGFAHLDVSAAQNRTDLQVVIENQPYRLGELGTGLSQFIVTLCSVAMARPSFVLIDEPELNLHPTLQASFLAALGSYAEQGVVFATHSVGLARSTADRIYSFQLREKQSRVAEFEGTVGFAEFLGEMSFSVFRELGYSTVLLVEGVQDVKTVREFLRQYKVEHRVVVIPLGGDSLARGGVEHELSEFLRLGTAVYALVDSERKAAKAKPKAQRGRFAASCKKLGITVHVTERRAIENYLSDGAVKSVMGSKYRGLSPFEKLGTTQPSWGKGENWRIARAMAPDDWGSTDLGRFLRQVAAHVVRDDDDERPAEPVADVPATNV